MQGHIATIMQAIFDAPILAGHCSSQDLI
jgi:hypothetical protein